MTSNKLLVIFLLITSSVFADDHAHFNSEALKPGVVLAVGFRTDDEIQRYTAQGRRPNANCSYDAVLDAAAMNFPPGTESQTSATQIRPGWQPALLTANNSELWTQFEIYWPDDWIPDNLGGLETFKMIQWADDGVNSQGDYWFGSGDLKFEMRSRFSLTDGSVVAVPDFRVYQGPNTDGDDGSNIRYYDVFDYDYQPGGDTWIHDNENPAKLSDHLAEYPTAFADRATNISPYLWVQEKWHRVTVRMVKDNSGVERITAWIANEDEGPILIFADPNDITQGYKVDYPTNDGFDQFWFEFNTSQESRTAESWSVYFRNFIVSTSQINYSGRPGSDSDVEPPSTPENIEISPGF